MGLSGLVVRLCWLSLFSVAAWLAYDIRLYAIKTFGLVIHEFDPWFNYRATEYLAANGWTKFFHWYDYMSWYPLGRPVGTTIYPGMQITSVALWRFFNEVVGYDITLNDVCCMVPAWLGASASVLLGLLASECSGSWSAGIAASLVMSIIPAHIMRSVGGGYDNESVAMSVMCATFYCWVRALREGPSAKNGEATRDSYLWGALAGLFYIYMAATWGGFIFVCNMVAFHVVALVAVGRYSSRLHRAYSLFFVIGTLGAMQVPVVNWTPLKSLEQLGALATFLCIQVLEVVEVQRRAKNLSIVQTFLLRVKYFLPLLLMAAGLVYVLLPMGYFAPLGSRIRGLFVKHTRTGNPLVDSVAEHQPANDQAYKQYLHHAYYLAPVGFALSLLRYRDGNVFTIAWACVAYFFANKMARLIILLGPVASSLCGIAVGIAFDQLVIFALRALIMGPAAVDVAADAAAEPEKKDATKGKTKGKGKEKAGAASPSAMKKLHDSVAAAWTAVLRVYNSRPGAVVRIAVAVYAISRAQPYVQEFNKYSQEIAPQMSNPSIMFKANLRTGEEIIVDDYREAYWWLRDNTPEDARVLAWWDYGYQITGIGNRTTLADGNTWNHEHIATLGRILSAPEKDAHRIARHVADYVLVWAGGGGDDLAKSPHMARIGNSIYHDICPNDPTCSNFGFYQGGVPTPMMKESLLYKLTQFGIKPEVKVDNNRFLHVFSSKYGKVRIFKIQKISEKSRAWVADPANRICDQPGSWMCRGQYPPALDQLIAMRKPFLQLEDFNKKTDADAEKYQEEYHKRMSGKHPASGKGSDAAKTKDSKAPEDSPLGPFNYRGCFDTEKGFGATKLYSGGATGANIHMAMSYGQEQKRKYVAIARNGADGHSFVLDALPSKGKISDSGCDKPCMDYTQYRCGCADGLCGDIAKGAGEEFKRRWVVYEVPSVKSKPATKKPAKKAAKKATKKQEL